MGLSGLAQFSVTPIDSIYETIYADSTISIFQIDLINATSDSLSLSWKLIEENVTDATLAYQTQLKCKLLEQVKRAF